MLSPGPVGPVCVLLKIQPSPPLTTQEGRAITVQGQQHMGNIQAIAGSGLRAAQQGMQVAAHNVANLATPDAQRLQMQRSSAADGGVQTRVTTTDQDPSAPLADLLAARTEVLAFKANAAVIRRADDMLGALWDEKA